MLTISAELLQKLLDVLQRLILAAEANRTGAHAQVADADRMYEAAADARTLTLAMLAKSGRREKEQ